MQGADGGVGRGVQGAEGGDGWCCGVHGPTTTHADAGLGRAMVIPLPRPVRLARSSLSCGVPVLKGQRSRCITNALDQAVGGVCGDRAQHPKHPPAKKKPNLVRRKCLFVCRSQSVCRSRTTLVHAPRAGPGSHRLITAAQAIEPSMLATKRLACGARATEPRARTRCVRGK